MIQSAPSGAGHNTGLGVRFSYDTRLFSVWCTWCRGAQDQSWS